MRSRRALVAEVPDLPGLLCYGADRDDAVAKVQALALRVIAERGWPSMANRVLRLEMILLLYVAQGIPIGLFFFAMPGWLSVNAASASTTAKIYHYGNPGQIGTNGLDDHTWNVRRDPVRLPGADPAGAGGPPVVCLRQE